MANNRNRLFIEDAEVLPVPFRNFSGAAGKYNRAGDRNFCVRFTDPETIQKLKDDGWNLKLLKNRDEEDTTEAYMLRIKVRYDNYPPKIYLISGKTKTLLDEDSLSLLDGAYFETVDLVVSPSCWKMDDGREGITGYLETGYFTIEQDRFAAKYAEEEAPIEDLPF